MNATRRYILVVDNLSDAADSQAELLRLWGYEAASFYGGAEALEAVRSRRPDAVLLDLGMPGMSGFKFTLCLRDLPGCGATPVVAITGHAGLTLQAREVGIDHYFLKPIMDLSLLQALLRRLLPGSRLSRSRATGSRLRKKRLGELCIFRDAIRVPRKGD